MIIWKIVCLLCLIYCVKYIIDRLKGKREDIGLDNTFILCSIGLILSIIFM